MGSYYWVVNLDRCIGCESCVVACKQEHNTLEGVQYRRLYTVNPELFPEHPTFRITISCNHCENPVCLKGCPAKAYEIIDGVVVHYQNRCLGCRYCLWICPYHAPRFSETKGKIEKCNLCRERLAKNQLPACVEACPTNALSLVKNQNDLVDFGDLKTTLPGLPLDKTKIKLRLFSKRRVLSPRGGERR